jgi:hypothetical protein
MIQSPDNRVQIVICCAMPMAVQEVTDMEPVNEGRVPTSYRVHCVSNCEVVASIQSLALEVQITLELDLALD